VSKNKDKRKEKCCSYFLTHKLIEKGIDWRIFSEVWHNDKDFREYYEIDRLMMGFTEKLSEIMEENNWSQKELANKLKLSNYYLGELLKGALDLSLSEIIKILLKLNKRAILNIVELEDDFVPKKGNYNKCQNGKM
jgi:hypothetical protein